MNAQQELFDSSPWPLNHVIINDEVVVDPFDLLFISPNPTLSFIGSPSDIIDIVAEAGNNAASHSDENGNEISIDATSFTFSPSVTLAGCVPNCNIETPYFNIFFSDENRTYAYEITDEPDGSRRLTVTSPEGNQAVFGTFTFATEEFNTLAFDISLNPVQDQLQFSIENTIVEKATIYNINGIKVFDQSIDTSHNIDCTSLKSGVYFLILESSEGKGVQKFVKL